MKWMENFQNKGVWIRSFCLDQDPVFKFLWLWIRLILDRSDTLVKPSKKSFSLLFCAVSNKYHVIAVSSDFK